MNASNIEKLIKNLAVTHEELLLKGLIPDNELIELFPGADELYLHPEPGMSIKFCEENGRFEAVYFTLHETTPSTTTYKEELPPPYHLNMKKAEVHSIFGTPFESSGPIRLPEPIGWTGGWETYLLDPVVYPNTKVVFRYSTTMDVNTLVFTLVDTGRE